MKRVESGVSTNYSLSRCNLVFNNIQSKELYFVTAAVKHHITSEFAVEISGATASWTADTPQNEATLKNLSMRLRRGKLCAIIGPVGSGKVSNSK